MGSVNELLELFTRQAALERAMRRPGGARVTEERELLAVRGKLAKLPATQEQATAPATDQPTSRQDPAAR
jgi:hypothetical protein